MPPSWKVSGSLDVFRAQRFGTAVVSTHCSHTVCSWLVLEDFHHRDPQLHRLHSASGVEESSKFRK